MLEKLANYYDEMHLGDYNNTSWLAEITLDFIEQTGMLPPTICYNSTGEYEKIKSTDILHDNDVSFGWEPEDEK